MELIINQIKKAEHRNSNDNQVYIRFQSEGNFGGSEDNLKIRGNLSLHNWEVLREMLGLKRILFDKFGNTNQKHPSISFEIGTNDFEHKKGEYKNQKYEYWEVKLNKIIGIINTQKLIDQNKGL